MLNKMTTATERQAFVFVLTEDLINTLGQPITLYVTQTGEFTFLCFPSVGITDVCHHSHLLAELLSPPQPDFSFI